MRPGRAGTVTSPFDAATVSGNREDADAASAPPCDAGEPALPHPTAAGARQTTTDTRRSALPLRPPLRRGRDGDRNRLGQTALPPRTVICATKEATRLVPWGR